MDLILIRHIATDYNRPGIYMGRSLDLNITPEGVKRFRYTLNDFVERFRVPKETLLLCSPLSRCYQTLLIVKEVLGLSGVIESSSEFNETNYGDFEGKGAQEIQEQYPYLVDTWLHKPAQIRFPRGESFLEVQQRAMDKLQKLEVAYSGETVLVCTHVDVIKMIVCALLDISIDKKVFFDISTGSFTHIVSTYRGLTVKGLNFV